MNITGGYLKSRKLISPKGENVRPTLSKTRESVFNVLSNLIDFEGSSFLDVFAGSGIMGIEAISRGFEKAAFIERDRKTYYLLKENLKNLNLSPELFLGDSLKVLKKSEEKFDVIYVDPPYRKNLYDGIIGLISEKHLLKENGILILEHLEGESINFLDFVLLKQKNYGDKTISFLRA